MIYPQDLEAKLGFDQIRSILKSECLSTLGVAYVEKMRFSTDFDLISKLLSQTLEFKQILERQLLFPSQNFIDVTPYLSQLRIEGICLEPQAFFEIKSSLNTIRRCLEFFEETEEFPALKSLALQVALDAKVYRKINDVIDDHGLVRDGASEELRQIRKSILEEESNIRKELDRLLRALVRDGYCTEDSSVTIRNGRMVLPVLSEFKRKVKGFIHGESGTGQTVFLEPTQVLEINNEIQDLKNREKREIVRILTELTTFLSYFQVDLVKAYVFLGLIDFVRCKSKFAIQIQGTMPFLKKDLLIDALEARHPLLHLSFAKLQKKVIPLSIKLDQHKRILLISGPNAGGKSICLKTVGLLQYMLQCGLLISCDDRSTFGIFQDILIDIGDEQSLENDLSTYSSHLTNMKMFLFHASKKSLILIDEFGGGTEPQFGAAIAESILEKLNEAKVFGVITTHFANLKSLADSTPGLTNGAMAFDMDKLEPLFKLEVGAPGSSFALELAQKIGLPEDIINKSKEKLGSTQLALDELIRKLEIEKTKFFNKNNNALALEKKYDEKVKKYEKLHSDLEINKNKYIAEAKAKAKLLFVDVNKKIEQAIRDIRESGADKVLTKTVREEIKKIEEFVNEPVNTGVDDKEELELDLETDVSPLKIGDWVKIKDNNAIGKLTNIKGKDADITIGSLNSKVKLDRLVRANRREYRELMTDDSRSYKRNLNLNEKLKAFSPHVDYRGMRGEDVLMEVIHLIDNALLFGVNELRIVHGKGNGILRRMIREKLATIKEVKNVADEHADRGGAGVTIVNMK